MEEVGVKFTTEGKPAFIKDIDDGSKAVRGFTNSVDSDGGRFGSSMAKMGASVQTFGKVALAAFAAVLISITALLGSTISLAGDYEAGLNRFAAVTGSALQDAGMSLKEFDDLFLKMGADTQYSAKQAQDAAINMAKGGIDPATIAAGGLASVLDLAAAGELDLAKAAEITAKQYGVWVDASASAETKAAFLADTANLLAQAANASTVNVDDLAIGLANVGGVAKVAGLTFEETVQTMALIAPGFSSASDAGTSFKAFLSNLVPKTKPAIEAMSDLGLYSAETGSAFYDLKGNFIGMEKATALLQSATKNLTQEERLMAFNTIFGSDAIRVAAKIAEGGAPAFDAMGDSMNRAGTAAEQAKKRNVGWNFALETLKGSIETLQIGIGRKLLPILTALLTNHITPLINSFMGFADTAQILGTFLYGVASNGEIAAGSLEQLPGPFRGIASALASIVLVGASVVTFFSDIWTAAAPITALFGDDLTPILVSFAAVVALSMGSVAVSMALAAAPIIALVAVGALLYNAWQKNFLGIQEIVASVIATVQSIIGAVVGFISAHWGEIQATTASAWATISSAITTVIGAISAVVTTVLAAIKTTWDTHGDSIMTKAISIWNGISAAVSTVVSTIAAFLVEKLGFIIGWVKENWPLIQQTIQTIMDFVARFIDNTLQAIKNFWTLHGEQILAVVNAAWTLIKDAVTVAINLVLGVIKTVMQAINGDWQGAWETLKKTAANFVEGIWRLIKDTFNLGIAALKLLLTDFYNTGHDLVMGIVNGITAAAGAVVKAISGVLSDALDAGKALLGIESPSKVAAMQIGKPFGQGIGVGIGQSVPEVNRSLEDVFGVLFDTGHHLVSQEPYTIGTAFSANMALGIGENGESVANSGTETLDRLLAIGIDASGEPARNIGKSYASNVANGINMATGEAVAAADAMVRAVNERLAGLGIAPDGSAVASSTASSTGINSDGSASVGASTAQASTRVSPPATPAQQSSQPAASSSSSSRTYNYAPVYGTQAPNPSYDFALMEALG